MPISARTMSGGAASMRWMASSPSPTATTVTSSSANVSSMTRWMVTLSSARRRVCGTFGLSATNELALGLARFPGAGVLLDEVDNLLHWRAGQENSFDADLFQPRDVDVRDDPADD